MAVSRVVRVAVAVAAAVGVTAVGGCGNADLQGASQAAQTKVAGCTLPTATTTAPPMLTQLGLLPAGAVVTSVEQRDGGRTVVGAVTPHPFTETLATLQADTASHGLTLTNGEVENRDAESDFTGQGYKGRWGVGQVDGCDTSTTVSVVIATDH